MKFFKFLAFMLVMIASVCFFASCSDDEDDKKTSDNTTSSFIVGTWKYQFDINGYVMWTFKADGSGSYYEWDDGEIDGSDTFTYTLDEEHERIAFYFTNRHSEVVKYTKKSNTVITIYDFFDALEEWHKQETK